MQTAVPVVCVLFAGIFSTDIKALENVDAASVAGRYLGYEGDDRIGFVIENGEDGVFSVTVYEDGLPGKGHRENRDDKYIGTAVLSGNELKIELNKKFDGREEEPVERELRSLLAKIGKKEGKTTLSIPKNREWDEITVEKIEKSVEPEKKSEEISLEKLIEGKYLGSEGDDKFGIEIGRLTRGVYPIVFYEDGLPGNGHEIDDDDRYEGTAKLVENRLDIVVTRKFDGRKEEQVEQALRNLSAKIVRKPDAIVLEIPRNREWDRIEVSKKIPKPLPEQNRTSINSASLPGQYFGFEGDDRIGIEIGAPNDGVFPITIYEDGLPGKGHNENRDDKYVGTAVYSGGKLEITLTQKFDGRREKPVENAIRKLTTKISPDGDDIVLDIPENREWDRINATKIRN